MTLTIQITEEEVATLRVFANRCGYVNNREEAAIHRLITHETSKQDREFRSNTINEIGR